ncbi:outer membrane beta-barrel protein [Parvularcula lutaonensis]|uniref:Outer membrane beta-barrel protein n=1 Tax=Parvularcula lutaonensis TaxID=491923 RepID=A0ABV7M907_9PROT|nr:outer membrane beta-barrel protein [Parvularcula lutaonensis]
MKRLALLAAVSAASLGIASAQGYFGAHLGLSSVDEDGLDVNGTNFGAIDYDDGPAFGFLGGLQVNKFFAGELEITGQSNDSSFFVGDETFTVTAFLANAVLSTPANEKVIGWVGVGAGFASTNLEDGGNAFATQFKGGVDLNVSGPHYIGVQAAILETDGFVADQSGTEFDLDYANSSYSVTYRFRF